MRNPPPNQTGKHWKLSKETREKQGLARKGIKLSEEHKKKLSESHKGLKYKKRKSPVKFSEEHIRKLSESHKGDKAYWKNKKHSDDTKLKISISKKGKKLSLETRKKMSESRKGAGNNSWKGGITPARLLLRRTLEYKLWREAVFKRDNYTCVWCLKRSGVGCPVILNADHIKRFADYPELRFAIDNGRTLCVECHKKTDTYGSKKQK